MVPQMWKHFRMWTCGLPEWQQCKKGNCLEQRLQNGSVCVMEPILRWAHLRHHMGEIWRILQATVKQSLGQVWLTDKFQKGNCSVDEYYNAIQVQVNLAKYPLEAAKILHGDIFWFFLNDEDFVSRTISDGSIDLDKFPASRVRQLAKKLESSKATRRHIKQVSGKPQVTQINLLQHQRTELPHHRYKKKRSHTKQAG